MTTHPRSSGQVASKAGRSSKVADVRLSCIPPTAVKTIMKAFKANQAKQNQTHTLKYFHKIADNYP
jgi:hypothetical protein